jgi:hypothetical protein
MKKPAPVAIKTHDKPAEARPAAIFRAVTRGLIHRTAQQEKLGGVYKTAPQLEKKSGKK